MAWRLAESLKKLREQINAAYPNRDKSSDGSVGDTSHKRKKSDHNPDSRGIVHAIDIDEDLTPSNTVAGIVAQIQLSRDKRVKYIIYEGRITVQGDITKWKPYSGVNPHKHHAHISVHSGSLEDDRSNWAIAGPLTSPEAGSSEIPMVTRDLKLGDKGYDVARLQNKLGVQADRDFGPATKKAVINVQKANGLDADGIVGAKTRAVLGL